MSTKPDVCVVIFASNVARLSQFYRELISMTVASSDAHHVALTIPGLQLVIHGMHGEPEPVSTPPAIREDTCIKVCFPIENIAAVRDKAIVLGGFIKPPEFEWESDGIVACDGNDPEGNVIQVRQRLLEC